MGVRCSELDQKDEAPALSHISIRVPLVRQPDGYTCGVAALQSVLHYFGHRVRFDTLTVALGATPEQGTNYRRMVAYAQDCGIETTVYIKMDLPALRAQIDAGVPVIVALQAWGDDAHTAYADAWDDGHYVVVVGYTDEHFYFMDPSTLGNYTFLPVNEFLQRWHDCYDEDGCTVRLDQFGMALRSADVRYAPDCVVKMG